MDPEDINETPEALKEQTCHSGVQGKLGCMQ